MTTIRRIYIFSMLMAAFFAGVSARAEISITSPTQSDTLKIGSDIRIVWAGSTLPVNVYYSDGNKKTLIESGNTKGFVDWTVPENDSLKFNFIVEEAGALYTELIWGLENAHDEEIRTCNFSPDGMLAITAGRDNIAKIWNIADRMQEPSIQISGDNISIHAAQFLHSSDSIVIAFNKSLVIYDRKSGNFLYFWWVTGLFNEAKFIDVHPQEDRVAVAGDEGILLVLNIHNISDTKRLSVPGTPNIYSVRFTPDGKYLLAGADDGKIYRYDWRNKKLVNAYGKHQDASGQSALVWSVAGFPDWNRILSGGADNRARIWNVADSTELAVISTHSFFVRSVDVTPNGDEFLTASLDSTLRLWDANTFRETVPALNHGGQILFARYSPTGDTIITAGRDKSFKIWRKYRPDLVADSLLCSALYPLKIKVLDVYAEPGDGTEIIVVSEKPYDTDLNRRTYPRGKLTLLIPYKSLQALPTEKYPAFAKTDYEIVADAMEIPGTDVVAKISARALLSGEVTEKTYALAYEMEGDPVFYPIFEDGDVLVSDGCRPKEASAISRLGKTLELRSELVQNLLRINTFAQGAWELTIYDGAGRAVISRDYVFPKSGGSEIELDVSSLSAGHYVARLSRPGQEASRSFLIVR